MKKRKTDGYKLFAQTYFILQYLAVRTLLFGFVTEPSLKQIYIGFRVYEIVPAALNFYKLFISAFTVQHYFQMIFVLLLFFVSFGRVEML